MKFSEEIGKITLPGSKSVLRLFDPSNEKTPISDMLCLSTEVDEILKLQNSEVTYFDKKDVNCEPKTISVGKIELLTKELFADNKPQLELGQKAVAERRQGVLDKLNQFGGYRNLIESQEKYPVLYSEKVYK